MLNGEIIAAIEAVANPAWQEDWDNSGLQVGSRADLCTGVLICVDVTEDVVAEAVQTGCSLIVSHHPLIFKGMKSIVGRTPAERCVLAAIRAGISVYSSHTALDNAPDGVSHVMAARLGVEVRRPLAPLPAQWLVLNVRVPQSHAESVRQALFDAGAGQMGRYDGCSFNVDGTGTFRPLEGSDPHVGNVGEDHDEPETQISVIVPSHLQRRVESALLEVHPYETPAYEFLTVANRDPYVGCGVTGVLDERLKAADLITRVKEVFGTPVVRCTDIGRAMDPETPVSRVAICGGAGGSMIGDAISAGAQVYITGDIRYHDFLDCGGDIWLMDIGHYEGEQCTKDIFYQIITQKFPNFAVRKSQCGSNPVQYV